MDVYIDDARDLRVGDLPWIRVGVLEHTKLTDTLQKGADAMADLERLRLYFGDDYFVHLMRSAREQFPL